MNCWLNCFKQVWATSKGRVYISVGVNSVPGSFIRVSLHNKMRHSKKLVYILTYSGNTGGVILDNMFLINTIV